MGFFRRLFGGSVKDDGGRSEAVERECAEFFDLALERLRAGESLSADELEVCASHQARFYSTLVERNGTEDNTSFIKDDTARMYLQAIKLAALGHPQHDAWPVMSSMRYRVSDAIEARIAKDPTPWLYFAGIMPAVLEERFERAWACYQQIADDVFLRELVHRWVHEARMAYPTYNRSDALDTLSHALPKHEPWLANTLAPERAWVLQATIHPFLSLDARTALADPRFAGAFTLRLRYDWGIEDREAALETLQWLATEGHRASIEADLDAPHAVTSPARAKLLKQHRMDFVGTHALAWDLCRGISVARLAYAAGFLTEDEAWTRIEAFGEALARAYGTWGALGDDYILGCRWADPADKESSHVAMVKWLQTAHASPWRRYAMGGV